MTPVSFLAAVEESAREVLALEQDWRQAKAQAIVDMEAGRKRLSGISVTERILTVEMAERMRGWMEYERGEAATHLREDSPEVMNERRSLATERLRESLRQIRDDLREQRRRFGERKERFARLAGLLTGVQDMIRRRRWRAARSVTS
jgi:hypothetical protein